MRSFASDNASGVHPAVMDALVAANVDHALAYGDDAWTERATQPLPRRVRRAGRGLLRVGRHRRERGVAAVAGAAVECGGLHRERAHRGRRVRRARAVHRLASCSRSRRSTASSRPPTSRRRRSGAGDEHHAQATVVSVTQSTECGTLYSAAELTAICETAHGFGMRVHLDGARLGNAVAALGCDVRALTDRRRRRRRELRRHEERDDVRRGGRLLRSRARRRRQVHPQAGDAAAVEDAVRRRAVRGAAHRRPVDPQRRARERDGARGSRRRRATSPAWSSHASPRSTACSSASPPTRSRGCRPSRSSGRGTRPSTRCGG